jgi:GntR family transcriptional regulator/MocR family aminotransferase
MRPIPIDRGSALPLIRQIYHEIGSRILSGELRAGERLPSTREAADELGVSRNVVMEAYEQLAAEGFLLGISGAGTFVAEGVRHAAPGGTAPAAPGRASASGAAGPGEAAAGPAAEVEGLVDFRLGRPALDLVPRRAWARFEYEARLGAGAEGLGSAPVEGLPELREEIRGYLWRRRGIECSIGQVVVTSGALHGAALLAGVLLGPGSELLFEDPGHALIREAFAARGARVVPVPVDEEGIRVEELPGEARPVLAFCTPSHQFPLGGCLSIQRRIGLVEWARERGCLLVEDDYESEFRYDVGPVSSIHRLDPGNVAYLGTFSKVFFPALRLGYLVLPEALVGPCVERKRLADRYGAPAPQLAMARFMREERLDRHIARMRKVYRRRRDALVGALEAAFGDRARINGRSTGLHLAVAFEGAVFDAERVAAIRRAGAAVRPADDYALVKGAHADCLALGYSHLTEEEIERGVAALAAALG